MSKYGNNNNQQTNCKGKLIYFQMNFFRFLFRNQTLENSTVSFKSPSYPHFWLRKCSNRKQGRNAGCSHDESRSTKLVLSKRNGLCGPVWPEAPTKICISLRFNDHVRIPPGVNATRKTQLEMKTNFVHSTHASPRYQSGFSPQVEVTKNPSTAIDPTQLKVHGALVLVVCPMKIISRWKHVSSIETLSTYTIWSTSFCSISLSSSQ